MNFFNNTNISIKLPVIIVTISLLTAMVTAGLSYFSSKGDLARKSESELQAILADRASSFDTWLTSIQADLATQSLNPTMHNALKEFTTAWEDIPGDKTTYLQQWYIENNPHPVGSKDALDYAADGSAYSDVHAKYHPYVRSFQQDRGYYDIFLFDRDGNLVYTVFKELDYATNLLNQKWSDTDLGAAFRAARENVANSELAFFDFRPYSPSHGAPASFISIPVKDGDGTFLGVMAFQMPIDRLNQLMGQRTGLGETGETYVVGQDFLMRSDSRFATESTILKQDVSTEPVKAALEGKSGIMVARDYRGEQVITAYQPLEFMGVTWAMLAEQSEEELFAPVTALRNKLLIQIGLSFLVLVPLGIFIARSISQPVAKLGGAMSAIAEGNYAVDITETARGDEIGNMANKLNQFRNDLGEAQEANREALLKGAAFNSSPIAMMVVDRDFTVTFVNPSAENLFEELVTEFRNLWPGFEPENIIGTKIDLFPDKPGRQEGLFSDAANLPFHDEISIKDTKISLNIGGVFDAAGECVGYVLEWQNVTVERLNEGVLAALNRAQGMIELTIDGYVLSANKNFLNSMGYALEEVVGKHHRMFVDKGQNAEDEKSVWARLKAGERHAGKMQRVAKGGTPVWFDASYNPILDGNGRPFKVVALTTDITTVEKKRHANEAELERKTTEQTQVVQTLAGELQKLSDGDLTAQIAEAFGADYEQLQIDFNSAVTKLHKALKEISENASGIKNNAGELSQASDDMSRRTEKQAAALQDAAASLEQITATVNATAERVNLVNTVANETRDNAEESGEVVQQAVSAMNEIEKSSNQISQIIGVIDEIAFQTNLLALNAGVEAARAGDAGRGFAVVASEVRALAQRSSEAAKEIKELISASSEHVETGVHLVGQAGGALEVIVEKVVNISTLIAEITLSAQEQAEGLKQVNQAVNRMDHVTQQNAAMAEQSTAATHALTQDARQLADLVSRFKTMSTGIGEQPQPELVTDIKTDTAA
jgi:methyl-accepting chemotaxis protein